MKIWQKIFQALQDYQIFICFLNRKIPKNGETTTGKANVQNDDESNDFGTMGGYTEGHDPIQPIEERWGITSC